MKASALVWHYGDADPDFGNWQVRGRGQFMVGARGVGVGGGGETWGVWWEGELRGDKSRGQGRRRSWDVTHAGAGKGRCAANKLDMLCSVLMG